MSSNSFRHFLCIGSFSVMLYLGACNTGIESTRRVRLSRSEKQVIEPTEEENMAAKITGSPLREWFPGKKFICGDNKLSLILLPLSSEIPTEIKGKELVFEGTSLRSDPSGKDECLLIFRCETSRMAFPTGQTPAKADTIVTGASLPLLIDPELSTTANALLKGQMVWTLSTLWTDSLGNDIGGKKYVPVNIIGVYTGNELFPMRVHFTDASDHEAYMWMSPGGTNSGSSGSRPFNTLFSLSDPKDRYPNIRPGIWELITRGELTKGMTKEECRLSLGNPKEVDSGHDWHNTLDLWTYPDGTYLQFRDGLLVDFRH